MTLSLSPTSYVLAGIFIIFQAYNRILFREFRRNSTGAWLFTTVVMSNGSGGSLFKRKFQIIVGCCYKHAFLFVFPYDFFSSAGTAHAFTNHTHTSSYHSAFRAKRG